MNTQIVTAFETLGLSLEQIAGQFDIEVDEVRAILFDNSRAYRQQCGRLRSEDEVEELLTEYRALAKRSEVDAVRERALRFLIDERKGRNDIGKETLELKKRQTKVGEIDLSLRIAQFNETLKSTRAQIESTLEEKMPA